MKITLKAYLKKANSSVLEFFKKDRRFDIEFSEEVNPEDNFYVIFPKSPDPSTSIGIIVFPNDSTLTLHLPIEPKGILGSQLASMIEESIEKVSEGHLENLSELANNLVAYMGIPKEER